MLSEPNTSVSITGIDAIGTVTAPLLHVAAGFPGSGIAQANDSVKGVSFAVWLTSATKLGSGSFWKKRP